MSASTRAMSGWCASVPPVMNRYDWGHQNEDVVATHLERAGYSVVARNERSRRGEVDIIAEKGQLLCFVEVRSCATDVFGAPKQTVSWSKQRKVVLAALRYLQRMSVGERAIRFDVASVVGSGAKARVEYIENAFDAGF